MVRSIGLNELVSDSKFSSGTFEQRRNITRKIDKSIDEFKVIVDLYAFDLHAFFAENINILAQEINRQKFTFFDVSTKNTVPGIFIDGGILIQLQFQISDSDFRHNFKVDLNALPQILHLFIGFGLVFFFRFSFATKPSCLGTRQSF